MRGAVLSAAVCLAIIQVCLCMPAVQPSVNDEAKKVDHGNDSEMSIENTDTNAQMCLEKTGYPCKTDDDCSGLSKGSCETICNDLMGVCYFKNSYDSLHFEKK